MATFHIFETQGWGFSFSFLKLMFDIVMGHRGHIVPDCLKGSVGLVVCDWP